MTEISKSQATRLLDVLFIGPFLVTFAYRSRGVSEVERSITYLIGIGTILYNARNFMENRRQDA